MCMQKLIKIFHSVEETETVFLLTEIGPRQSLCCWKMVQFHFFRSFTPAGLQSIWQSFGLGIFNINVYAKVYKNIPLSSKDRGSFSFSRKWILTKPRLLANGIWQTLWATSGQYQCVCKLLSKYSHDSRERPLSFF